jgi:maltose O-acetyltransferase
MDSDFHSIDPKFRMNGDDLKAPVFIGDNGWIGSRVLVFRGVSIGKNSVIGAGSVVTKDIPENTLAVGVPARKVRDI